jgi:hypothetical protein
VSYTPLPLSRGEGSLLRLKYLGTIKFLSRNMLVAEGGPFVISPLKRGALQNIPGTHSNWGVSYTPLPLSRGERLLLRLKYLGTIKF